MKMIIVNGASSAGCTSLVHEFAAHTNGRYQAVHIDEYLCDLPAGMWNRCSDTDEGWAEIGMAFNEHLAVLAQGKTGVIADAYYKLHSPIKHLFRVIGRENVFFVQLYCDLEELERREKVRGDRRMGLARSQFEQIYSFDGYDLMIDSTKTPLKECVKTLMAKQGT